ncbi:MAG: DNA internalization-related competence protein ComEC/Rec2 [Chloroflexota bacterium]
MTITQMGLAWLAGTFLGPLLSPAHLVFALLASLLLPVAIFLWRRRFPWALGFAMGILLLGALRYQAALPPAGSQPLQHCRERGPVEIIGRVTEEPDVRDRWTYLRVQVEGLTCGDDPAPAAGAVQVRARRYPEYRYGDVLRVRGQLSEPPVYEDFSYRDYLARRGIYAVVNEPRIEIVARDRGNPLISRLLQLKSSLHASLVRAVPEPQASLLAGILLGLKPGIPDDLKRALATTALTHIIVISGYNISVIAGAVARATRQLLGYQASLVLAMASILLFLFFAGWNPPVLRASLMSGLTLLASLTGRISFTEDALVLAAAAMTAHDPMALQDLSFQLSFLATAGLVLVAPSIEGRLAFLPPVLRGPLAVSLAAQAMTAPLIAYDFHQVSLVGPLANLVALPIVPWAMLTGATTAGVGLLSPDLANVSGWTAWLTAGAIAFSAQSLGSLALASVTLPRFHVGWVWLYFILVVAFLSRGRLAELASSLVKNAPRLAPAPLKPVIVALLVAGSLLWLALLSLPDGRWRVTFLDVGQGDSILIQTAQGQKILVDGGPSPSAITAALGKRLPFWDRSLDLVVLSHPHEDHLAGLVEVLSRYHVTEVLEPPNLKGNPLASEWTRLVQTKGIKAVVAESGQLIKLGEEAWLEVLYPNEDHSTCSGSDANNCSIVLRLVIGRFTALLPGDLEAPGQDRLLGRADDLKALVLKVPHHGSASSLDQAFLDQVSPEVAILSLGKENQFGFPATSCLRKLEGIKVFRTDLHGNVEVTTDGRSYSIRWDQ